MAQVTVTVNNADVADVIAGLEREYKDLASRLAFPNNPVAYDSATNAQKGQALLKAVCFDAARKIRLQRARDAVTVTDPDIT